MLELGRHRKGCDGGDWMCQWCNCAHADSGGKRHGPAGARSLCSSCGSQYSRGHSGPPETGEMKQEGDIKQASPFEPFLIKREREVKQEEGETKQGEGVAKPDGMHECGTCASNFTTMAAARGHIRYCSLSQDNGHSDDIELLAKLVATRGRGMEPEAETMMVQPDAAVLTDPQQQLDILQICSFLDRFSVQIKVEDVTPDLLTAMFVTGSSSAANQARLVTMHMRLLRVLMEDTQAPDAAFYEVDMKDTDGMLDNHTWAEVLRKHILLSCPERATFGSEIRQAAKQIVIEGYEALKAGDKIAVLSFLCNEVLSTDICRYSLEDGLEQECEIEKQRLEAAASKKKRGEKRELHEWVGKKIMLLDGSTGVVDSGTFTSGKGFYRVKLDGAKSKIAIKEVGDMILVPVTKSEVPDAPAGLGAGAADGATASVADGASASDAQSIVVEEDDVEAEEKLYDEQETQLLESAIRTEPLGQDRHHSRYWLFPSRPDKLFVEHLGLPNSMLPPAVKAFVGQLGSLDDRQKAADDLVRSEFMKLPVPSLQQHLQALGVGAAEIAEATQTELVERLVKSDHAVQTHSLVLHKAAATARHQELMKTPKKVLEEVLVAFAADVSEEVDKDILVELIEANNLVSAVNRYGTTGGLVTDYLDKPSLPSDQAALDSTDRLRPTLDETESTYLHKWECYETPQQLEALMAFLNPAGARERDLRASLIEASVGIITAMQESHQQAEIDIDGKNAASMDVDEAPLDPSSGTLRQQLIKRQDSITAAAAAAAAAEATKVAAASGLDSVQGILFGVMGPHVAVIDENLKKMCEEWVKKLIACADWAAMRLLAVELATMIDHTVQVTHHRRQPTSLNRPLYRPHRLHLPAPIAAAADPANFLPVAAHRAATGPSEEANGPGEPTCFECHVGFLTRAFKALFCLQT